MSIPFLEDYNFLNPYWFLALLLLPAMAFWYFSQKEKRYPNLNMPSLEAFAESSWRGKWRILLPILRMLTVVSLIIAMARPQLTLKEEEVTADGIDIVLAMDLSISMLAQDFKPNRLAVSKEVASNFIDKRKHDRIGLVVFAGEAFTQCPPTVDHKILKHFLAGLECGVLKDGTAIGMGLSTAVNRLISDENQPNKNEISINSAKSKAKSKIVILLTDGYNNRGYIQPKTAAKIAKELKIKVYTIAVGSNGMAMAPLNRRSNGGFNYSLSDLAFDEQLLEDIAAETGGKHYRAVSPESLEQIYSEIDKLEKTKIQVTYFKRYSEEFYLFALIAIILLSLEIFLRYTLFRTIP